MTRTPERPRLPLTPPLWRRIGVVATGFAMVAALGGGLSSGQQGSGSAPEAEVRVAAGGIAPTAEGWGLVPASPIAAMTLGGESDGTRSGIRTPLPSRGPLRLVAVAAAVGPSSTRAPLTRRTLSGAVHPDLLHAPPGRRRTPVPAA